MLTSVITANTPRDVNYIKDAVCGEALERLMIDTEIRVNILDGFLGGTDTVSKISHFSLKLYQLFHFLFFLFSNIDCEYNFKREKKNSGRN